MLLIGVLLLFTYSVLFPWFEAKQRRRQRETQLLLSRLLEVGDDSETCLISRDEVYSDQIGTTDDNPFEPPTH